MLKSIAVTFSVLATATVARSGFELYKSEKLLSDNIQLRDWPDWPNVTIPENFRIDFSVNHVNNETHQLEQIKNTTAYQYIDSIGNREMTVVSTLSDDGQSLQNLSFFYNCSSGIVTYNVFETNQCFYTDLQQTVDLQQYIKMVNDPNEHINFYAGRVRLPYAEEWLNQFILYISTPQGMIYENMFFSEEDNQLKYIYLESDQDTVYKTEGLVEQIFTDEDFAGYEICDQSTIQSTFATGSFPRMFLLH